MNKKRPGKRGIFILNLSFFNHMFGFVTAVVLLFVKDVVYFLR